MARLARMLGFVVALAPAVATADAIDDLAPGESSSSEGGADTSTGGTGGSGATTGATAPDPTGPDPTTTAADETTGGAASDDDTASGCGCHAPGSGALASLLFMPLLWRRKAVR